MHACGGTGSLRNRCTGGQPPAFHLVERRGSTVVQTLAKPNRCAMSLKKMRTWAMGLRRTSSLFM